MPSDQWRADGAFAWGEQTHLDLQERFKDYLAKAKGMFTASGLSNLGDSRWQRALLSIGDYLLPSRKKPGRSWSMLPTDPASWKRLLRGTGLRSGETPASQAAMGSPDDRPTFQRAIG